MKFSMGFLALIVSVLMLSGCPGPVTLDSGPGTDSGVIDSGVIDAGNPACSPSNPSGTCPSGQNCMGGSCCPACGATCCGAGQTCVAAACCDTTQVCGASCCATGQVCNAGTCGSPPCDAAHPNGSCQSGFECVGGVCAQRCVSNGECGTHCCGALMTAGGMPIPDYGICSPNDGTAQCRCDSDAACNGAGGFFCTPIVNGSNNPLLPYVCTARGCTPYRHCSGIGASCGTGYCELCNSHGCFCTQSCSNDSMCGGAHCTALTGGGTTCSDLHGCVP